MILLTQTDYDAIRLSIKVAAEDIAEPSSTDDGFPIILARTLGELSCARLACGEEADGGREWAVDFLPVVQSDLFGRPAGHA